jgi:hypothetical protein
MRQKASQLAATLLGLSLSSVALGQSCYTGTIGTLPIELSLEGTDIEVQQTGMYVYTKYDTPIELTGTLKRGVLTLTERLCGHSPQLRRHLEKPGYWPAIALSADAQV